jgi:uncharacterized protein
VIAVDTGYLYALLDPRDRWHTLATALITTADEGWITTWPVLTEATNIVSSRLGLTFALGLLDDVARGGLAVWSLPDDAALRAGALMRKYANLPMDLADASLVLLAEHLGHGRILSTDMRDFGAYRWKNRKPFKNLMGA